MAIVSYASRIAALSPSIHLRLSETSSTFADSGSAGTTGTLTGSAARGVSSLIKGDSSNAALSLTGGHVTTGAHVNTSSVGLSLALAIQFNALVNSDVVAIGTQNSGVAHFFLRYITSGQHWRLLSGFTSGQLDMSGTPLAAPIVGRNYLLIATRDDVSGVVNLYWDGRLISTGTAGASLLGFSNQTLTLGDATSNYRLDELVVLNGTVLTVAQVRNLYLSFVGADDAVSEFWCSPSGAYNGAGTVEDPLDFQCAVRDTGHAFLANGGATVWLRGGDYTGNFQIDLAGTSDNPTAIRNVRGEHVRLLAPASNQNSSVYSTANAAYLAIDGDGHRYDGGIKSIEILNPSTDRIAPTSGSNPPNSEVGGRGNGSALLLTVGHDITVKNVWFHDCGNGLNGFEQARNIKAVGCLMQNNGWVSSDRGHGHNVYQSNLDSIGAPSQKAMLNCIALNSFGLNYKTDSVSGAADNLLIEDCIASNAGYPAVNYYYDTNGVLKTDGVMTSASPNLTGSGFTSGMVGYGIRVEGAGRGGRALLTHIKTFTDSTHVVLGRVAATTVSGATYRTLSNGTAAWGNNILLGSGGYNKPNHDCVVRDVSAWLSNWGCGSLGVWLGYTTAFNYNLSVTGLRAMGGSQAVEVNRWQSAIFTGSKALARPIAGLSASYANEFIETPIDVFVPTADYAVGSLTQPTVKTGYCYRCTTGGLASTQPTWPTGSGATVTTGAVTFTAPTTFAISHTYAVGDLVVASSFDNNTYLCRAAGTSAGSEPTWQTTKNALTTSGGAIFQALGSGVEIKPYVTDHTVNNNAYHTTGAAVSGSTRPFHLTGFVNEFSTVGLNFTQWQTSGWDASSTQANAEPTTTELVYHWQDPATGGLLGRGAVAVYNWELLTSVTVDLTGSGLVDGQTFEIRDGEDYANTILASGVYGIGGSRVTSIAVSTQGTQIAVPLGYTYDFQSTKPEFMILIVIPSWRERTAVARVSPPPDRTAVARTAVNRVAAYRN